MDPKRIEAYGDELYQALVNRSAVAPLTEREPGITIADAYQIQLRMIQRRLDTGETVVGKKIGMAGGVTEAIAVAAGDHVVARFQDLGQVAMGFV